MQRKYVGFDIEIAKAIPEGANLKDERPLGITCVAFDAEDANSVIAAAGDRMTPDEVRAVVERLELYVEKGYTIVTWNGLAFDFDILAEESADPEVAHRVAKLAISEHHVDLMFHFVCVKGFRCALAKACEGMEIEGKTAGMSGIEAPKVWAEGDRQKVLEYVAQDARIQRLLAEKVHDARKLFWITQKGTLNHAVMGVPRSVPDALKIPEPDTSWMDNPPQRKWFFWWTKAYGAKLAQEEQPKVF